MIDSRVKRFVVGLILFIALACLGAVAALFVWVNEKAVQKTVEEFADTALGAYARFDGPIGLKRLSTLEIELPAIKFIDKSTDVAIGRIAGARAEATAIVERATKVGQNLHDELVEQARVEKEEMIASAKEQIEAEKRQAMLDIRSEVIALSTVIAGKIIDAKLDSAKDKELTVSVTDEVLKNRN